MKQIIIFREKHGNRYFDSSTNELRNAACLVVLQERFFDFWYEPNDEPSSGNILSEEQIAQLPTELLRNQEAIVRRDYLGDLRRQKEEIKFYERAKLAIETKDGKAAYQLLLERVDAEYEDFDVKKLEETNFGG